MLTTSISIIPCSTYILHTTISTIWDNRDECGEQYICTTVLYLLSVLSHAHGILIDSGVGSYGYEKYVLDGLNATYKRYLSMLITTAQLPNATKNNSQMVIHTSK